MMLERVQQTLTAANNNVRTALHQLAANGDVEAVQSLVENYHPRQAQADVDPDADADADADADDDADANFEFDIDIQSPKRKVTALHAALIQNQQGFIIDYLISKGADVNAFNQKGFNPVILAIRHCRPDTIALEKLIGAGAQLGKFPRGRFASLSPLDIAMLWKNERAVEVLKKHCCVGGGDSSGHSSGRDGNLNAEPEGSSQGDDQGDGKGEDNTTNTEHDMNNQEEQNTNEKRTKQSKKGTPKKRLCPICNCFVKFPSRMSFIGYNQNQAEKEYALLLTQRRRDREKSPSLIIEEEEKTVETIINKTQKKKKSSSSISSSNANKSSEIYTTRKYLDEFMSHSNGQAYQKLCNVEYHGVNNISKMRKEISESYSVLHAVQQCWTELKGKEEGKEETKEAQIPSNISTTAVSFENVFLIDLCSGKSLTTALSAVLLENKNNKLLAVDKLPAHMVPHFLHGGNASYLSRDIMSEIFFNELKREVHRQSEVEGRMVILVGMHLCGILSERAIEFFEKMPLISGIVLSPCCLPKPRKGKGTFVKTDVDEEDAYLSWSDHLELLVKQCLTDVGHDMVKSYRDDEIHSIKNSVITAIRQPAVV